LEDISANEMPDQCFDKFHHKNLHPGFMNVVCVKDVSGRAQQEGKVGSTGHELDCWMKTMSQPWTVAMATTILAAGPMPTSFRTPPRSRWLTR
jgi:hypothetical protein